MSFFGQSKIVKELLGFVERIKKGENYSFLIIARTGMGKTHMVKAICNMIDPVPNHVRTLVFPCEFNYNPGYRLYVLDEIHRLNTPEVLYPFMDAKRQTFFLMSNLKGELVEPLRRRCITFTFQDYTESEVKEIIREELESKGLRLPDDYYLQIALESNLSPGIAKDNIIPRLINLFGMDGIPKNLSELKEVMKESLGIIDGLNEECRLYLAFLAQRQYSSLDTVSAYLQQPPAYVKYEVEPILIKKGLIQITSRGRTLTGIETLG